MLAYMFCTALILTDNGLGGKCFDYALGAGVD